MKLMTHLVAGYPSIDVSEQTALMLAENGSSVLEIQFPFSDPVADGPVIAKANQVALEKGMTTTKCFDLVGRVANRVNCEIVIMTYYNVVMQRGVLEFCEQAKKAGANGLIIPDYPIDEEKGNGLIKACEKVGLNFIPVIAPTTREDRMREVLSAGTGFVYCMARAGITGNKTEISDETKAYLSLVKKLSKIPVAVGFGISEKAQIDAIGPYADMAVVGSALIRSEDPKALLCSLKGE